MSGQDLREQVPIYWRPRVAFCDVPTLGEDEGTDTLVTRWCELMGLSKSELNQTVDREDWIESVVRVVFAIDQGLPVVVFGYERDPAPVRCFNGGRFGPDAAICLISPVQKFEPLLRPERNAQLGTIVWPPAASESAALRYGTNEAFIRHAGRRVRAGTVPPDDSSNPGKPRLYDVMAEMVADRAGDFLLKMARPAKTAPNARVQLHRGATSADAANAVFEAFDWAIMSAEGIDDAVLVQDYLPMGNEYRFFVVNGVPTVGAGCIEKFSPLERSGDFICFDTRIEDCRGSGVVRSDPALVARYAERAKTITADLLAADPAMTDYVLDLATTKDGEIVMIEANPISSSGLYAIDPGLLVSAAYSAALGYAPSRERMPSP